jgi:1,4-alpha-glucan branching enzyme
LAEQLAHPEFKEEMRLWVDARIRTSAEEAARFAAAGESGTARLAAIWEEAYRAASSFLFGELDGDLLGAFADLERSGTIELATCGATHGYLPLLARDETIALQVALARRTHETRFGRAPQGMWLPEAAYRPAGWWRSPSDGSLTMRTGVEDFLARERIRYFLVDSALLTGGTPLGTSSDRRRRAFAAHDGVTRPRTPLDTRVAYWVSDTSGAHPEVAAFVRDPRTALQVWSRDSGYPGDPAYLEFHKKSEGGGHRYWRVTGADVDLADKVLYVPEEAAARVRAHAEHFASLVRATLDGAPEGGILVAPFDAELFGHWWNEGVDWLEGVLERLARDPAVRLASLADHLERNPPDAMVRFPEGSWGAGGRHDVWANPAVKWTWRSIHRAEHEVWALVERARRSPRDDARRIAIAALRQLLLLVSSDWQFLITTGSAVDYATARLELHADDALRLAELGRRALAGFAPGESDLAFVESVEARDDPFPHLADVVSLAEPPRAFAATGSLEERFFRREEREDRFPRARRASP